MAMQQQQQGRQQASERAEEQYASLAAAFPLPSMTQCRQWSLLAACDACLLAWWWSDEDSDALPH
jgi:hypothetical protein